MPTAIPPIPVAPMQLRNIMSSLNGAARLNKRAIDQVDKLLGSTAINENPFDDEDDPTQVRYPPRSRAATSTRTLLSTSAAFADPLEQDLPDDGPVALVERARRNVEKLQQHRDNLRRELEKTNTLITQWELISRSLDLPDDEEFEH